MLNEFVESFATGFCIGAVGSVVAVAIWIIYELVRDMKKEDK